MNRWVVFSNPAIRSYRQLFRNAPAVKSNIDRQYWLEDHVPQDSIFETLCAIYDEMPVSKSVLPKYISSIIHTLYYSLDGQYIEKANEYFSHVKSRHETQNLD
jgi:hypothetical protein